ncbi:11962_t:CDS:2 [Dentiscutata heterogama]|uniref:11962_t:CDS:1 n=1 Tax=Dentiscutata heterogama TaxID=1316150 RepID=A0ACA9NYL0_9GLOM|nr:11962_t:CDS:2 [Dentiscutata heterogama]
MWFAQQSAISLGYCSPGIEVKVMFVIVYVARAQPLGIFVTSKEKATLPRYLIIFDDPNLRV